MVIINLMRRYPQKDVIFDIHEETIAQTIEEGIRAHEEHYRKLQEDLEMRKEINQSQPQGTIHDPQI